MRGGPRWRRRRMKPAGLFWGLLVVLIGVGGVAAEMGAPPIGPATSDLDRGREVYEANCAICHGVRGDGNGRVADSFRRRPQSFRTGRFKFRSTPSGSLPLDGDLFRTITRGVARTGMIPHDYLDEADRWAVVSYIKTFSPRFQAERPGSPISIAPPPNMTPDLVARGRLMYVEAGCSDCHGGSGKGDGPYSPKLKDAWGDPFLPSDLNLTRFPRESGPTPGDLYRAIATGLDGTPMPSYADALTPEEIWAIATYVYVLPRETEWAGLPEGNGAELVRRHCTICHSVNGPSLARQDRAAWTEIVDRMIRWGAPIRAKEREIVIQYLSDHFGARR